MGLFRAKIVGGLVAAILGGLAASAYACCGIPFNVVAGCTAEASNPSCTYLAAVPGDISGQGRAWHVHIARGVSVIDYDSPGPGRFTDRSVIQPGDIVTASAGDRSCVGAGQTGTLCAAPWDGS